MLLERKMRIIAKIIREVFMDIKRDCYLNKLISKKETGLSKSLQESEDATSHICGLSCNINI